MFKVTHLNIKDINPCLSCRLCNGYLIDATTIVECLHSFCRSCILKYLETSNACPVCDVVLHKTRPHYAIKSDKVLQSIVYKLVPSLFDDEMKSRRHFYEDEHPEIQRPESPEKSGDVAINTYILQEDDRVSLELAYWSPNVEAEEDCKADLMSTNESSPPHNGDTKHSSFSTYLLCPSSLTVCSLKKLLRMKLDLEPGKYDIYMFLNVTDEEYLASEYSLSDLACLYTGWGRGNAPMKITFTIMQTKSKDDTTPLRLSRLRPANLTQKATIKL